MLTGIEIMLDRMKTHPEEFVGVNGGCSREWYQTVMPVLPYLTDEEKDLLTSALAQAYRDHFNGEVLKTIAGECSLSNEITYTTEGYNRSLMDGINGTRAKQIGAQKLQLHKTQPSAFGAVPIIEKNYPEAVAVSGSS